MEKIDLKQRGLKVTVPRLKILAILEANHGEHMSAEDVFKALLESGEDVGLATVYRVLTQFEQADILNRLHFAEGHSVFELNQGEHHDHILCVKCGEVSEFTDDVIEKRQEAIAKKVGYEITHHSLYLYGICPACQKK